MPGIVVGVDGSEHSHKVLEWAMNEAALRQAPLTVHDRPPGGAQQPMDR